MHLKRPEMKVLWLNDGEVREVLRMKDAITAVEEAFRQHGLKRVQMPPKLYLYFLKYEGDLRTMPAYIESLDIAGVKIVNAHPGNPSKGLPTVMAIVVLNDPKNGAPIALMNATHLTSIRTGAGGGVAVKYLARKDSKVVGMVGSGAQARTQLIGINEVIDIEEVKVSGKSDEGCKKFKEEMEKKVSCDVNVRTIEDVCDCDILVTATPVRKPVVKSAWISEGTHINAIGADAKGKQELDSAILRRAKIVVDDLAQAVHSGEVNVPLSKGIITEGEIYAELGEILTTKKKGRESDDEITVFDSTGLAIQDVATASLVYREAKKRGLGKVLELF